MRKARIGVIGAGWWATENHLPILEKRDDVQLAAVCRLGEAALRGVKDRFGFAFATEDYTELLERVALDGVIVSSPHHLHYEHTKRALERGVHVMVEKPMTTTAAEARALVDLARQTNRQLLVPCGWNFKPYTEQAHRWVRDGAIGAVEHLTCQMASPLRDLFSGEPLQEAETAFFQPASSTWADPDRAGGYGWGQLCHALSLLFWLLPIRARSVFAWMGTSDAGVDLYDTICVRFEHGQTGTFSGAATVPKHCGYQIDIRVFGSEGMLLLDIERERLELRRNDRHDQVCLVTPGDGAYTCVEPVERFVDICLGRDVENPSAGEVGMRAVEVIETAYRSAHSGRVENL